MSPDGQPAGRPVVLTVAGSDSGGGAGIQADLATFLALGAQGACAITAVTAQNSRGISAVHPVPPEVVAEQIRQVCTDVAVAAAKTGMLGGARTVEAAAAALAACGAPNLVVDPVLASTTGTPLLSPDGRTALITRLLPLALVVTPNLAEAGVLLGKDVSDLGGMGEAARALHDLGPRWVLVKGGHLPGAATDVLFGGHELIVLGGDRIDTPHTHGTGCVLSAGIAAYLSRGREVPEAVHLAKAHVTGAIHHAMSVGQGAGSVDPAWNLRP